MTGPVEVVSRDPAELATSIATRLVTTLVEAQEVGRTAHVVLTGGGIGTACLAALAALPAKDGIDWDRLHVWWGDERYVDAGSDERNDTGARTALLDHVPIPDEHVHEMPPQGRYRHVEAAAYAYAEELATAPGARDGLPPIDICLLGIGPDAHVASIFPEHPAGHAEGTVVAVHGSPKPPPTRISLTLPAIRRSTQVWILASGASKTRAVRLALDENAGPLQVPAAGARGVERTLFLVDAAAAADLPPSLPIPPV